MMQIVLVGIPAGAAAALLFASVASGSLLSILLFYLAPLPILIAALGWTHWAGLLAALSASVALAAVFGGFFFFAFLAAVALPAWWLGYLAMLARPDADGTLEWYPTGRLVLWSALLGAGVVIAAIPYFGLDEETFRAALQRGVERVLRSPGGSPLNFPSLSDPKRVVDFLVIVVPATAAVLATITQLINLWLAARIVKFSNRSTRPWPDLSMMTLPIAAAVTLVAAVLISLLGGLVGIGAGALSATLLVAFAILGLAVLHHVTRGIDSRAFVLAGTYAAVFVFGWPMFVMSLLGLAETGFGLRARFARRRPPPAST